MDGLGVTDRHSVWDRTGMLQKHSHTYTRAISYTVSHVEVVSRCCYRRARARG
ncbi:unnamed protein product, partial [Ceratitis capitata]